jgi:hypothetical protein
VHAKSGPAVDLAGGRARLSAGSGELLGRRGGVYRREEPPSYEAGLRAHGSSQPFHKLLGHAALRAPTTAPSLTGLDPGGTRNSHSSWVAAQGRPGRWPVNPCRRGGRSCQNACIGPTSRSRSPRTQSSSRTRSQQTLAASSCLSRFDHGGEGLVRSQPMARFGLDVPQLDAHNGGRGS